MNKWDEEQTEDSGSAYVKHERVITRGSFEVKAMVAELGMNPDKPVSWVVEPCGHSYEQAPVNCFTGEFYGETLTIGEAKKEAEAAATRMLDMLTRQQRALI